MHCWGGLLERGNPRNDRRGGLGRIPDHDLLRGRFADDPGANVPAGQLQAVRQQLQAGRKRQRRHRDSGIPRRIHHAQRIYGPLHAQRRLYGDDQLRRSAAGGQHGFLLPGSARLYDTRPQDDSKTITASLTNSVISLECGEWFKKYYSEAQFTVQTEAGNNFSFTHSSSPDTPIFVKPGSKLLLKGTAVKAQNGVKVEFPQQQIGVTTARTWHKIRIDASQAGQGSISIRLDDTLTEVPPQEIELNPEA